MQITTIGLDLAKRKPIRSFMGETDWEQVEVVGRCKPRAIVSDKSVDDAGHTPRQLVQKPNLVFDLLRWNIYQPQRARPPGADEVLPQVQPSKI